MSCKPNIYEWPTCCHLLADDVDELHAFAGQLGLNESWFHEGSLPHYELNKARRLQALELGAQELEAAEVALRIDRALA